MLKVLLSHILTQTKHAKSCLHKTFEFGTLTQLICLIFSLVKCLISILCMSSMKNITRKHSSKVMKDRALYTIKICNYRRKADCPA